MTLEYVRWAAANIEIPWFAIGGINLGNLAEVMEAGATRVCAVSAILNSRTRCSLPGICPAFRALAALTTNSDYSGFTHGKKTAFCLKFILIAVL